MVEALAPSKRDIALTSHVIRMPGLRHQPGAAILHAQWGAIHRVSQHVNDVFQHACILPHNKKRPAGRGEGE